MGGWVYGSDGHKTDTRIANLQNVENSQNRIISNLQKTQSAEWFNSAPGHGGDHAKIPPVIIEAHSAKSRSARSMNSAQVFKLKTVGDAKLLNELLSRGSVFSVSRAKWSRRRRNASQISGSQS